MTVLGACVISAGFVLSPIAYLIGAWIADRRHDRRHPMS